jgi:hypothetical protein
MSRVSLAGGVVTKPACSRPKFYSFFFFWWECGLNSELHTGKVGALLLKPYLQSIFLIILKTGSVNYLPRLSWNQDPPDLSLLSSSPCSIIGVSHQLSVCGSRYFWLYLSGLVLEMTFLRDLLGVRGLVRGFPDAGTLRIFSKGDTERKSSVLGSGPGTDQLLGQELEGYATAGWARSYSRHRKCA